jgi:hypothetical protein
MPIQIGFLKMSVTEYQQALIREAKRIEEDSLFSAKSQFESAHLWGKVHFTIGVPAAVLAAIASASAFQSKEILAGVLGIIVTALTALATFLNPNKRADNHHAAGAKYNGLRNQARMFYEVDLKLGAPDSDLQARLRELAELRDELNHTSPQVSRWAFKRARKGIEAGEANHVVDQRRRRG